MTEPTNSSSTSEGVKHPCPRCGATDYHQFNGAIGCLLCGLMHGRDPSDGFSLDAAKAEHDNWFCWKEIEKRDALIKTLVEAGNGIDQLLKRLMQGEPITPGMYSLVAIASIKFHQAKNFLKIEGEKNGRI